VTATLLLLGVSAEAEEKKKVEDAAVAATDDKKTEKRGIYDFGGHDFGGHDFGGHDGGHEEHHHTKVVYKHVAQPYPVTKVHHVPVEKVSHYPVHVKVNKILKINSLKFQFNDQVHFVVHSLQHHFMMLQSVMQYLLHKKLLSLFFNNY
jgi:hypothetical protein